MDDLAYQTACEDARDDWHWFGIHRTQEEVEREAERYREMAKEKGKNQKSF